MSQNSTPDPNDADKLREWTNKQIENYSDSSSRADNNLVKDVAKGVASELGRIALGVVTLGLSEESRDKDRLTSVAIAKVYKRCLIFGARSLESTIRYYLT